MLSLKSIEQALINYKSYPLSKNVNVESKRGGVRFVVKKYV